MQHIAQQRISDRSDESGAAPAAPANGLRTLLIVDDEEGPRQSLNLIFNDTYQVVLAENGLQALEIARHHPIDAAVLDIRMAGMSGIELLSHLKAIDSGMEVTILTAYAALETARQALRLGATDYLTKPFDLGTIRSAVARMMERRTLFEQTQNNLRRLQGLEQEVESLRGHTEILNRSEIYGDVLHDINKPLTVIVGMLSLLNRRLGGLERVEGEAMAQLRQRLTALNRQADNVIDVIQRYLGFLRHEDATQENVKVNQVLQDLRELLKVYPGAQNRLIAFRLLPTDVVAAVNGTDLLQALLNLTVNALQATPDSEGVHIRAWVMTGPLPLDLWHDSPTRRFVRSSGFQNRGPLIAIAVRDEGDGIPPEVVQRIFDHPVTTKPRGRGTGLGLTIVKRLVLQSRSALALETQPGVGTEITLFLPAAEPAAEATPETGAPA